MPNYCGSIVDPKTLCLSYSEDITPSGVTYPLVAKIPVVISESDIQIDFEAKINFPEPYLEIKRVKKSVYLTQCKLIPGSGRISNNVPVTGKLFIAGYVRKNIEYATPANTSEGIVCGDIKHTTVDVPFECVSEVTYTVPPQFNFNNVESEVDYVDAVNTCNCGCGDTPVPSFPCEKSHQNIIVYTEKPYCELISARIYETELHKTELFPENGFDCFPPPIPPQPPVDYYQAVIEKMVLYLRIKILQVQQININDINGCC